MAGCEDAMVSTDGACDQVTIGAGGSEQTYRRPATMDLERRRDGGEGLMMDGWQNQNGKGCDMGLDSFVVSLLVAIVYTKEAFYSSASI